MPWKISFVFQNNWFYFGGFYFYNFSTNLQIILFLKRYILLIRNVRVLRAEFYVR